MRRRSIGLAAQLGVLTGLPLGLPTGGLLTPSDARAQLLDFGSGAPEPGTGAWALAHAERLEREADSLESAASADGITPSAIAFRVAMMRLGADLMRRGEARGTRGSELVLAGRTISARLEDLDPLLRDLSTENPGALEAARAVAVRAENDDLIEIDVIDRRVRRILAPLCEHAGERPHWSEWRPVYDEPDIGQLISDLESERLVSREAIDALHAYESRLKTAEQWRAFEASAQHARALVHGASMVLRLDERWLGTEHRDLLIDQLDAAMRKLASDPDQARRSLLRLMMLDRLVRTAQASSLGIPGNTARDIRDAMQELCAAPESEADTEGAIKRMDFALGALSGISDASAPDDGDVVRQLRPAMRVFETERREARRRLSEAIPTMLTTDGAPTDPGLLAVISAHESAQSMCALVLEASRVLQGPRPSPLPTRPGAPPATPPGIPSPDRPGPISPVPLQGGDPVVSPAWQRVANVLLSLGQAMTRPSTADDARASLLQLCTRLVDRVNPEWETDARGALSAEFDQLTGGRGGELLMAIGAAREAWLARVEDEGAGRLEAGPPQPEEIDRLERLMPILHDGMDFFAHVPGALNARDSDRSVGRMSRTPAWELSSASVLSMARESRDELVRLTRLVLDNDHDWEEELQAFSDEHALMLTIGRLERIARTSGVPALDPETREGGPAGAAVWELAAGPVPPGIDTPPMVELRPLLAELCRYAEEAHGRVEDADPDQRSTHAAHATEIALRVRRAIESSFNP